MTVCDDCKLFRTKSIIINKISVSILTRYQVSFRILRKSDCETKKDKMRILKMGGFSGKQWKNLLILEKMKIIN